MKIAGWEKRNRGYWHKGTDIDYEEMTTVLDIAERALKLLEVHSTQCSPSTKDYDAAVALLAEVADECDNCRNKKDGDALRITGLLQPRCADCGRSLDNKPTVREKVEEMLGMEYSVDAALRTLADEIDRLKR